MQHIRLPTLPQKAAQFYALTKPRVTQLAVFCAVIGMFLASPALPSFPTVLAATFGIWLLAGAAFAINCLVEREIDARMARTARRPMPLGELRVEEALTFASIIGAAGMALLYREVNALTMWLTFGTFVGYAIVYTILLKPATSQNIVIGGAAGAMPPALGWAAVANHVPAEAWLLVLIIFLWTPPHFWALALYRTDDFRRSGLPMLPITHGPVHTRLQVFLYTIALIAATLMPYAIRMSGLIYLAAAVVLGGVYLMYSYRVWRSYTDVVARAAFRFSIVYLALLFAALLLDHYLRY
jgi:protoheme IX farnesyltransferase